MKNAALGHAIDGLSARPPELTVACVRAINDVCTVKLAGNHEAALKISLCLTPPSP